MAPRPRLPFLRTALGAIALTLSRQGLGSSAAESSRVLPREPADFEPPGPQRLPILDGASLLQTHLGLEDARSSGSGATGDNFPAGISSEASGAAYEELLPLLWKHRREQKVPWFYSPALDELWLGGVVDRLPSWSSGFTDWSRAVVLDLHNDWPGSAEQPRVVFGRDKDDVGQVFEKIPLKGNSSHFALRTIFGRYLSREHDGMIKAWRTKRRSNRTTFVFLRHPLKKNRTCWTTPSSLDECVSLKNSRKEMATSKPKRFKVSGFFEVHARHGYVTLKSKVGSVLASRSLASTLPYRQEMQATFPFETGTEFLAERGLDHEGDGMHRGAVAGAVVGWFLFMFAYSVHYNVKHPETSSALRLPMFDVAKFLLEASVMHLHLGLVKLAPNLNAMWMTSFRMPAFMVLAGIFGSNVAYESVAGSLCRTVGASIMLICLWLLELLVIGGPSLVGGQFGRHYSLDTLCPFWFLHALAFYRVLVSPLFDAARRRRVQLWVPLVFVKLVSFFLMIWVGTWKAWVIGNYVWVLSLNFAPYFALGLLLKPADWDALFRRWSTKAICTVYFVGWYLLVLWPAFLQFNRSYCLADQQEKGCKNHYDPVQVLGNPSVGRLVSDTVMFALRAGISVSFVGVVYVVGDLVQLVLPALIEWTAGWGSRTLYAYVLHIHCICLLNQRGHLRNLTLHAGLAVKVVASFLIPFVVNATLSTRGTEHLFQWLLSPMWMKDLAERGLPRSWLPRREQGSQASASPAREKGLADPDPPVPLKGAGEEPSGKPR